MSLGIIVKLRPRSQDDSPFDRLSRGSSLFREKMAVLGDDVSRKSSPSDFPIGVTETEWGAGQKEKKQAAKEGGVAKTAKAEQAPVWNFISRQRGAPVAQHDTTNTAAAPVLPRLC
jgi:hypothetical protein